VISRIYEIGPEDSLNLELDEFSKLTTTYTAEGLNELKNDIVDNGQLVPIILREGKILDGRHRHKVCNELNMGIMCKEVGSISDEAALNIVVSNAINKSTNTDASKTEAYLICKAKGVSKSDMPKTFSRLNSNYVSKLSFIDKENPEYLNVLLHQNKIRLYNAEFKKVEDYGTINGLWRTLKANKKLTGQVVEVIPEPVSSNMHPIDLESYFDNTAAESEYWDIFNMAKIDGTNLHPGTALGKKVASLIKCKYSG
tara:strand:+ start:141 stop:905 length:765 start_codon:yes stop_codon:yes gene_type:complete